MNGDYYYYCTYNETKIITCPSALNFQCTIVLLQLWTIQSSKVQSSKVPLLLPFMIDFSISDLQTFPVFFPHFPYGFFPSSSSSCFSSYSSSPHPLPLLLLLHRVPVKPSFR